MVNIVQVYYNARCKIHLKKKELHNRNPKFNDQVGKHKEKRPLGTERERRIWEDNIEMYVKPIKL